MLTNGFVLDGKQLCEEPKRGRKITYITKVINITNILALSWKADSLLINKKSILTWKNLSKNSHPDILKYIFDQSNIKYAITLNFYSFPLSFKYSIVVYRIYQMKLQIKLYDLQYGFFFKITSNYRLLNNY
uniref:hypothetical protein n=1 Tax=Chroothece richteriana TaxID=101928 RepID=UPI001FCE28BA|nr:hypothetical protein MW631_pgp148 [Chroothece richteriana]UNJ14160.1 hypothetical protein [Chroothece richteriana]